MRLSILQSKTKRRLSSVKARDCSRFTLKM